MRLGKLEVRIVLVTTQVDCASPVCFMCRLLRWSVIGRRTWMALGLLDRVANQLFITSWLYKHTKQRWTSKRGGCCASIARRPVYFR